ncbi:MAG: hypothetical protein D6812_07565 [Deltaproteobacteria bacterium]|nr:MAG: hypothetical protein D6812_07565 [Deltaproteobacteria bacterium]
MGEKLFDGEARVVKLGLLERLQDGLFSAFEEGYEISGVVVFEVHQGRKTVSIEDEVAEEAIPPGNAAAEVADDVPRLGTGGDGGFRGGGLDAEAVQRRQEVGWVEGVFGHRGSIYESQTIDGAVLEKAER